MIKIYLITVVVSFVFGFLGLGACIIDFCTNHKKELEFSRKYKMNSLNSNSLSVVIEFLKLILVCFLPFFNLIIYGTICFSSNAKKSTLRSSDADFSRSFYKLIKEYHLEKEWAEFKLSVDNPDYE